MPKPTCEYFCTEAACELALRVKTDVASPLAGTAIDEGLKEHVMSGDELVHPKVTVPLKPFTAETATLKFVELPADTVALVGLTEALKSHTCS
jgi:hypothetical protein